MKSENKYLTWYKKWGLLILKLIITIFLIVLTLVLSTFLLSIIESIQSVDIILLTELIGIILTFSTLIFFIIFNFWNNSKANKRLEQTLLKADEHLRETQEKADQRLKETLQQADKHLKETQRKADERLKKTLNKELELRNKRVKKSYDLLKEFFDKMGFEEYFEENRVRVGFKFRIEQWEDLNMNTHQKTSYIQQKMEAINAIDDGFKCLGINLVSNHIFICQHRYILRFNAQALYINKDNNIYSYEDDRKLRDHILEEMRFFAKNYYDIEINV